MNDQPQVIPAWLVALVGRLVIENEALRDRLANPTPPDPPEPS
jgi:hypothetical protein